MTSMKADHRTTSSELLILWVQLVVPSWITSIPLSLGLIRTRGGRDGARILSRRNRAPLILTLRHVDPNAGLGTPWRVFQV
jgi:hypothetical protein